MSIKNNGIKMKIKKFDEYNELNEGLRNWIATGLLMVSLGLIPKAAISKQPLEIKEIISELDSTEKECLKFLDTLNVDTIVDFPIPLSDIENKLQEFKKDTGMLNNFDTAKDFLTYIDDKKDFPLKPSLIKIAAPLPDGKNVIIPLYMLDYTPKDNLLVSFSTTGVINSLGLTYKF